MKDEIIVAIISSIGSIIITILSLLLTDIIKKMNFKSTNEALKRKEQYEKVFSPIHRILFFNKQNRIKAYIKIKKILTYNYSIVPQGIIDSFNKTNNYKKNASDFEDKIEYCFHYLGNKLDCSKQKLDTPKEKIAKEILECKSEELIISSQIKKVLIITTIIVLCIYYLLYFTIQNTTIAFLGALIIPLPIAIIYLLKSKLI